MIEKDAKQLSEQEIEQVTGGEGGAELSWAELVCPACHGKVEEVRTRIGLTWYELVRYKCTKCGETWKKSELVKEE